MFIDVITGWAVMPQPTNKYTFASVLIDYLPSGTHRMRMQMCSVARRHKPASPKTERTKCRVVISFDNPLVSQPKIPFPCISVRSASICSFFFGCFCGCGFCGAVKTPHGVCSAARLGPNRRTTQVARDARARSCNAPQTRTHLTTLNDAHRARPSASASKSACRPPPPPPIKPNICTQHTRFPNFSGARARIVAVCGTHACARARFALG